MEGARTRDKLCVSVSLILRILHSLPSSPFDSWICCNRNRELAWHEEKMLQQGSQMPGG